MSLRVLAYVCLLLLALNATSTPHVHEDDQDTQICAQCAASDDGVVSDPPAIRFTPPPEVTTLVVEVEVARPSQFDCLWRAPKQGPPGRSSTT
jgi:hypothetical protein